MAVQRCLETDNFVAREIERTTLPDRANKKRSALRTNLMKVESLVFELSLTRKGGRVTESAVLSDLTSGLIEDKKGEES